MKRISLFLVFLVLVSCSKKDDVRAEGQFVNMKNPMVEVSEDGMKEKLGFYLNLPAFAKEPKFFIISDEMAQIDFFWNENKCTARMKPTVGFEDISGFYYSWEIEKDTNICGREAKIKINKNDDGNTVGIILWYDAAPGLMYSASMKSNADETKLEALANAVYIPMQGES